MGIKHIGIYANSQREEVRVLCQKIVNALVDEQISVYTTAESKLAIEQVCEVDTDVFCKTIELLLVVGGDGTFLRAVRSLKGAKIPLLGINKGHLGFLSELESEDFFLSLKALINGDFSIESRMMIYAEVYRNNKFYRKCSGLNDLVINRNHYENTLTCEVYLNNSLIDRYCGDGIIVATPTGSTGYSLSAGGPLIYPGTDCFIVNPICSHFLGTPAVIVPAQESVDLVITRSQLASYLFVDGSMSCELLEGDQICISRSRESVELIHLRKHPFFEAVRNKLLNREYRKQ